MYFIFVLISFKIIWSCAWVVTNGVIKFYIREIQKAGSVSARIQFSLYSVPHKELFSK
jgi:hypothetical protein